MYEKQSQQELVFSPLGILHHHRSSCSNMGRHRSSRITPLQKQRDVKNAGISWQRGTRCSVMKVDANGRHQRVSRAVPKWVDARATINAGRAGRSRSSPGGYGSLSPPTGKEVVAERTCRPQMSHWRKQYRRELRVMAPDESWRAVHR